MRTSLILVVFLFSCAKGHCKREPNKVLTTPNPAPQLEQDWVSGQPTAIKIYYCDLAKQCEKSQPQSDQLRNKLEDLLYSKKIKFLNPVQTTDGFMRAQMCGMSLGRVHVFEVKTEDFDAAKKLGFDSYPPKKACP